MELMKATKNTIQGVLILVVKQAFPLLGQIKE